MNDFKTQALKLHQRYTSGKYPDKWLELTFTHTEIVLKIALQFVERLKQQGINIDLNLLTKGIYLHDIGVYSCYDEDVNPDKNLPAYIMHGFIGHQIIKKEGFPENVCRFASTHTATGLTKEDIKREKLDVKLKDYIPVTLEEEILCFADKFHTKYPSFNTFQEQIKRLEKFDPNRRIKMEILKKKFGLPNLTQLKKQYDSWNEEFDRWFESLA